MNYWTDFLSTASLKWVKFSRLPLHTCQQYAQCMSPCNHRCIIRHHHHNVCQPIWELNTVCNTTALIRELTCCNLKNTWPDWLLKAIISSLRLILFNLFHCVCSQCSYSKMNKCQCNKFHIVCLFIYLFAHYINLFRSFLGKSATL